MKIHSLWVSYYIAGQMKFCEWDLEFEEAVRRTEFWRSQGFFSCVLYDRYEVLV